jgi:hypothetical protein
MKLNSRQTQIKKRKIGVKNKKKSLVNLGWYFIHEGGILRLGSLYWEKKSRNSTLNKPGVKRRNWKKKTKLKKGSKEKKSN